MDQIISFSRDFRKALSEALTVQGRSRIMIVTTVRQVPMVEKLGRFLNQKLEAVFSNTEVHTPIKVTERALAIAGEKRVDCIVSIGGGSTTGLGKALSFRLGHPHIAIPTTYSGSEATPFLGETHNGNKTIFSDTAIRPEVVIYDPNLVTTLPRFLTITSGLNAVAHAVEALYAKDASEETSHLAIEGLKHFGTSLQKTADHPEDLAARESTLKGAWCCGAVLGQVGMAVHHKLCHILGGSFGLPHATTHSIILPHAVAFNRPMCESSLRPICDVFGTTQPETGLWQFARNIGAPLQLRSLNISEDSLRKVARMAVEKPYWNPRPVNEEDIFRLLMNAWIGNPPELLI